MTSSSALRRITTALVLAGGLWCAPGMASAQAGAPATQPQYGTFGLDTDGEDKTARPGDGFFRFANGTWIDRTEIPADKPGYSLRAAMTDLTEKRLHEMMEQAAASAPADPVKLDEKVGAFYKSFMDEARIEQLGAKPLDSELAAVRAATTRPAIAALMGRNNMDFEGTLFNFGIDNDFSRSIKFNDVKEINDKFVAEYVKESVALNKAGFKRTKQTKEATVPEDLYKALRKKPVAGKFFDSLANGYKNEFIELVESAKKQETRDQRIQKVVALCSEGVKLNDKYKKVKSEK